MTYLKAFLTKHPALKNYVFWIGAAGIVLSAAGIEPDTLTSWPLVWEAIVSIASNPVALIGGALGIIASYTNTQSGRGFKNID